MKSNNPSNSEPSRTGFAGLSQQVSDIESTFAEASRLGASNSDAPSAETGTNETASSFSSSEYDQPIHTGNGGKAVWWIVALASGGVFWAVTQSGNSSSSFDADTYSENVDPSVDDILNSPSPGSAEVTSDDSGLETATDDDSASVEGEVFPDADTYSESIPMAGYAQTHSVSEIRYCLAEEIRMSAAEAVVDEYDSFQVDRFNETVADYNSRCGQFRYRPSDMTVARSDVEARRPALEQEGRDRVAAAGQ